MADDFSGGLFDNLPNTPIPEGGNVFVNKGPAGIGGDNSIPIPDVSVGQPDPNSSVPRAGVGSVASGAISNTAGIGTTITTGNNNKVPNTPNQYSNNVTTIFPSNLPYVNGDLFAMLFQFYRYVRPSILISPTVTPLGAIALPLPNDMLDRPQISYSEVALGTTLGAGLLAAQQAGKDIQNSISSGAGLLNTISNFSDSAETAIGGISAGIAGKMAGVVEGYLGLPAATNAAVLSLAGLAQNPFLTVLFNSPTFKRHVFTWTFIPENIADTENLNYILNKFRFHMHPAINSGLPIGGINIGAGILLNYPDMVKPTLLPSGYLYDFKYCVIESVLIDYAPANFPSFFPTNAPSAIRLTINLLEIELWTQDNYINNTTYLSNA